MELVISIVSWNTRDLLRRCLASLLPFCRSDHSRIVVIDNASSDGTPTMMQTEFPTVTFIQTGANLGFGKAHNLIARNSNEPFVLFLNPDTEFTENAHASMLDVFKQDRTIGVVGCSMTNLDGTKQQLGFQTLTSPWTEFLHGLLVSRSTLHVARRLLPYHDPDKDGYVRKLYGGCLMVRRTVLDQIGWFDERFFMYGEDVDLSRRIENAGWKLYYLSSANIIHICGGASTKAPGRFATLMQCESISKLMDKYYGPLGRRSYALALFTRASARITILSAARFILFLRRKKNGSIDDSWLKNLSVIRWCLGMDRAAIPQ